MRLASLVFPVVGAFTGLGLAVLGFQGSSASTATSSDTSGTDVPAVGRPLPVAPAQVTHRWAACGHRAHLVRGTCVTVVDRTVTVYDPAPAVAPPTTSAGGGESEAGAGSPARRAPSTHREDERSDPAEAEHESEPEHEHEDESSDSSQPEVDD